MRATYLYGGGDVRVERVPDPELKEPTDALVRVVRACVCGSDLHPYRSMKRSRHGRAMGHEMVGVVEDVGRDVATLRRGELVIAPFAYSDSTCDLCREGLHTSCRHGGFWGGQGVGGLQAEAVRVPLADGTLVGAGVGEDSALLPSLLTLSDVFLTGHHAAVTARVRPGATVAVVGDGAVGLSAVLASRRLGAERVILLGRHADRTALGVAWGATDVVAERGAAAVARVRELTGGDGAHAVLEAVGHRDAYDTAVGVVRAGGVISRVGVPQYDEAPIGGAALWSRNVTLTGGPAPVRAYLEELLPEVLDGRLEPGSVFDRELPLEQAGAAYRAMDRREALKVMLRP